MKIPAYLLLLILLLNGCSAGRYYKPQEQNEILQSQIKREATELIHDLASSCSTSFPKPEGYETNTVFVHPGLLMLNLDWDQSLAVESAKVLIKNGYAKDFLQLRDRNSTRIGERMLKDPGTHFIGLHYSMGGQPQLLADSLSSVAQARRESGKDIVYSPVLVDPFGIEDINTLLDLDAEHLGQIFIILSEENALFRPSIKGIRGSVLHHPKVHIIYAEDIGENWNHFDALGTIVNGDVTSRFHDVFFLVAQTIVEGRSSAEFERRIALMKIRYSLEDSRPINAAWLKLARELSCIKESNAGKTS